MRYFLALLVVSVIAVVGVLGFRGSHSRRTTLYIFPDMEWQLKLRPQKPDSFFTNGISSQFYLPGTVAQTKPTQTPAGPVYSFEDVPYNTGRLPGSTNYVENSPLPYTAELLKRGQQRYTINCSPCHGALGDGNGITKKIGAMAVVGNLHDKRMVEMTDGEIFYVISNGRNLMGSYGANVVPSDRWAIVSYVRALQLSQLGSVDDLPAPLRANLKK